MAKDTGAVARGMSHYRENCLPCHGSPGVDAAEFQEGMNPTLKTGAGHEEHHHGEEAEGDHGHGEGSAAGSPAPAASASPHHHH